MACAMCSANSEPKGMQHSQCLSSQLLSRVLQLLKPAHLEPMLHNRRSQEKPVGLSERAGPAQRNQSKARTAVKTSTAIKK